MNKNINKSQRTATNTETLDLLDDLYLYEQTERLYLVISPCLCSSEYKIIILLTYVLSQVEKKTNRKHRYGILLGRTLILKDTSNFDF